MVNGNDCLALINSCLHPPPHLRQCNRPMSQLSVGRCEQGTAYPLSRKMPLVTTVAGTTELEPLWFSRSGNRGDEGILLVLVQSFRQLW